MSASFSSNQIAYGCCALGQHTDNLTEHQASGALPISDECLPALLSTAVFSPVLLSSALLPRRVLNGPLCSANDAFAVTATILPPIVRIHMIAPERETCCVWWFANDDIFLNAGRRIGRQDATMAVPSWTFSNMVAMEFRRVTALEFIFTCSFSPDISRASTPSGERWASSGE